MDLPDHHARRPAAVAVTGGAVEGDVVQRAVQPPGRRQPPLQDHRGSDEADRAEVDVRAAHLEPGEHQPLVAPSPDPALAGDRGHRVPRHPRVGEGPVEPDVEIVEEPRAGDGAGEGAEERQGIEVGADGVEIEIAQLESHVAHAEAAPPLGDRDQLAAHVLTPGRQAQVPDVVLGARAAHRARGEDAASLHRGEIGRHPAQVLQVHVGRDHLEIVEDGVPRPGHRAAAGEPGVGEPTAREAEDGAVAPQHDPAGRVAHGDGGIVDPGRQGIQIDGERKPVGGRDAEPAHPGREIGQEDDPAQSFGALLDGAARPGPLGLERGVLLRLGDERAVGIPGERDPQRAAVHPHVVEVHQRRLAARCAFAELQYFLEVHPTVAVLDELDHRTLELHRAQHHLTREQVGELVAHPHPRDVRQQRPAGVPHDQVLEHQVVKERAGDRAHVHVPQHDPVEHAGDGARQQVASRRREGHGGHDAEHHGERAEDEDEEDPCQATPHQNGCPTAKWTVIRPSRSST